ncbi:AI-2E family transporter [Chitinophagaceae bacterium LWZ2-11]
MENKQDYKMSRNFFLAIIIVFACLLLYTLLDFFTAFLAALMFYVLSRPFAEWLIKRKKWKKSTTAIIIILISFFIILLPIGLIGTLLYSKVLIVAQHPQDIIQPIEHFNVIIKDKFNIDLITPENLGKLQGFATALVSSIVNSSFNFFTTITMMYFFLYFMIQNINRMEASIVLYLPFHRSKVMMFGHELKAQTFSNAIGVPLIALVHGLLAFAAYYIAGLDEAGFWGVMTGFASIVPIVGTGLIWAPAAVYLLATGHTWQGIFVIGWGLLIIGTSDNVIRFMLAKRMANVHPIVTVLGVIIGLKYFGITGLIFGPLIISYFLLCLKIYYAEYRQHSPTVSKPKTILPNYLQPKKK